MKDKKGEAGELGNRKDQVVQTKGGRNFSDAVFEDKRNEEKCQQQRVKKRNGRRGNGD